VASKFKISETRYSASYYTIPINMGMVRVPLMRSRMR